MRRRRELRRSVKVVIVDSVKAREAPGDATHHTCAGPLPLLATSIVEANPNPRRLRAAAPFPLTGGRDCAAGGCMPVRRREGPRFERICLPSAYSLLRVRMVHRGVPPPRREDEEAGGGGGCPFGGPCLDLTVFLSAGAFANRLECRAARRGLSEAAGAKKQPRPPRMLAPKAPSDAEVPKPGTTSVHHSQRSAPTDGAMHARTHPSYPAHHAVTGNAHEGKRAPRGARLAG